MATDYTNNDIPQSVRDQIEHATSVEQITEICRQRGIATGALVRSEEGFVTAREVPQSPTPQATRGDDGDTLLKRAVRLPDNSIQLITAYSESGLDTLQRGLLKQFGMSRY